MAADPQPSVQTTPEGGEAQRRNRIKVVGGADKPPARDEVPGGQTENPAPGQSSTVPV